MNSLYTIDEARQYIQQGRVIAYPTEAVYGLGCDPFNQPAVEKILALKHRSCAQGFILLIASWTQLAPLIGAVADEALNTVRASWPGPVTWVFPKSQLIPEWISGKHDSVAIRLSAHPLVHQLCVEGPIVSTSANISGQSPARSLAELNLQFADSLEAVLMGDLGMASKPSAIFDVLSGKQLR